MLNVLRIVSFAQFLMNWNLFAMIFRGFSFSSSWTKANIFILREIANAADCFKSGRKTMSLRIVCIWCVWMVWGFAEHTDNLKFSTLVYCLFRHSTNLTISSPFLNHLSNGNCMTTIFNTWKLMFNQLRTNHRNDCTLKWMNRKHRRETRKWNKQT